MGCQAEPHYGRNRTTCMHRNRNPGHSFMVNMASDVDCACTRLRRRQHGGHIPANSSTEAGSLGLQRTFISYLLIFSDRIDRKKPTTEIVSLVANSLNKRKTQEKLKPESKHMCVNFTDQQIARTTRNYHTFEGFLQDF